MLEQLVKNAITKSYGYKEYRELVSRLVEMGKSTAGEQSETLTKYTQLNDARMRRWDKTFKIPDDVKLSIAKLQKSITFVVLTESWCGDAAPCLPVLNKIAEASSNCELRILLRDENLELMSCFLTNKALSIPKLIIWDNSLNEVVSSWGPRPMEATKMVREYKEKHGLLTPEFRESLQKWYNTDKGKSILKEVVDLLPLK